MADKNNVIGTIGRRKTSVARVYLSAGTGEITVNGKELETYFPVETLQTIVKQPFAVIEQTDKYDVNVNVIGGGFKGQAEAVRLGIARALCFRGPAEVKKTENGPEQLEYPEIDKYAHLITPQENREKLKKAGFLTRDSRMVERKKYGRRKARRKFQFSKR